MLQKVKVVIDTNVMISSLWGGKPHDIIQKWVDGNILMVASREILNEYLEVFKRFNLPEDEMEALTIILANPKNTILVTPKDKINLIKADPDDNKFLECAVAGKAGYIISGDKHLLNCAEFKHCKILTPSDFLDIF
jgi:putative PIN family toxin of toxin-antitoxin system